MKKALTIIVSLFIIGVLVYFGIEFLGTNKNAESEKTQISYALDWKAGMDYAGVYVAQEKGFFAEEGLEVEITQGHGGPDAAKLLSTGKNKIGNCTGDATVIGISKGMNIISLAVTHQKSPVVLFALSSSHIKNPKDLIGKKIGINYESIKYQHYLALLNKLRIPKEKINEVGIGWEVTPLLTGQVDALLGYIGDETVQALKAGKEINVIPLSDYGIDMYNECIAANTEWLAKNEETAKKMVRAIIKGWKYAIDHPDEAVEILSKLFPEQDKKFNKMSFEKIIPILKSKDTEEKGIGIQTKEGWQQAIDLLYDQKLITYKPPVEKVYTNRFLPSE